MKILWFCIPAYGHTNPTLEVVRKLVQRGHTVRYYSFGEFRGKIEATGAEFVACDRFLPDASEEEIKKLRKVSTTEMSVKSFGTTAAMDGFLAEDIETLRPDLIVSDSVCFWGKLTAQKYGIPMVCSTTTFAFNEHSSRYMKYSAAEMADMMLGLPRLNRALKKLRPLGYHVKSALEIVQNKNDTDTIVYTSARFQPCSETFDPVHYRFVGPSVRETEILPKDPGRPLIYISLGTVINDHPDFYHVCIRAFRDMEADVLISCGKAFDRTVLGELPDNVTVEPYVDQMQVLAKCSLFITHCGMNSVSEGLYMAVPLLLFPLTGEQQAVARRVCEMGAGRMLDKAEAKHPDTLRAAAEAVLGSEAIRRAAEEMSRDLRACPGADGAADFIEQAGRPRT